MLLTESEVSQILGLSTSYLRALRSEKGRLDDRGELRADFIPFVKISNLVRYPKDEVMKVAKRLIHKQIYSPKQPKGAINE